MYDINVQFMALPPGVHGASVINEDSSYTIFVDPNDSDEVQMAGYAHEMRHISNGDFFNVADKQAAVLETRNHR